MKRKVCSRCGKLTRWPYLHSCYVPASSDPIVVPAGADIDYSKLDGPNRFIETYSPAEPASPPDYSSPIDMGSSDSCSSDYSSSDSCSTDSSSFDSGGGGGGASGDY